MGTDVLSHKGGGGHGHGLDGEHDELVNLVVAAPSGHGGGTKKVDIGLDKNVGKRGDDALNGGGKAYTENFLKNAPIKAEVPKTETVDVIRTDKDRHGRRGRNELGKNGCIGNAGNAHMELEHENKIQDDVEDACEDQEIKGSFRISHGAENAASHVIKEQACHTGKVDSQIQGGFPKNVGWCFHEAEHKIIGRKKEGRKQQAEQKGRCHGRFYGTVELFMVAGTKIFPDDDGGSDGKSIKEEDRHICDHRCGADGCQGVCPDEVSHYNGVNRIVEHLKDVAHHQGEGKFKKQFGNAALGHIFCHCFCLSHCGNRLPLT